MQRIPWIDPLRGVAAGLVLVSHVAYWSGGSSIDGVGRLLEPGDGAERFGGVLRLDAALGAEGLRERLDDEAGDVMLLGAVGLPTGETFDWQQSASVATLFEREWRDAADAISAVGHPVRLAILHAVLSGSRT